MHLAIRVDGGPEIGYGHLTRSNALAEELLNSNHEVTVATTTPTPTRSVFPDAVEVSTLSSRGDPEPFLDWLDMDTPDAVYTDSYLVDTKYQQAVRDRLPLAVLQDDDHHAVCADLFINGNFYAHDLDYEFVGDKPKTCLGSDYVLLRSEIRDRAEDDPPWRERPERALVTMGGSDVANLTPTAIRAFDGVDIYVDAIVGPGFSDAQEQLIRAVATEISADVSVLCDPDDLVEKMFQADFAVSTSSSTTYELLALGTPIISVPVTDHQVPFARKLRERNVAHVLEGEANTGDFKYAIKTYNTSPELRRTYRNSGRQIVDGQGAERIYAEVLSLVEDNT